MQHKLCLNDSWQMFIQPILLGPMNAIQPPQTNYLFQQFIILLLKCLICLSLVEAWDLYLSSMTEKGLLVSSLHHTFRMSPLSLLISGLTGLSSFSVSHRPRSLSLWSYLLHPCELSPFHCFSQVRYQKRAVTLLMPKRERTVPLFYFILPLKCISLRSYMRREFESHHHVEFK